MSGGNGASARRGSATSASPSPISLRPWSLAATMPSRWCCPTPTPKRCSSFLMASRQHLLRTITPSWCSTKPDGTAQAGSSCPPTSPSYRCRHIRLNSTPSSASGCTSRPASSHTASTQTTTPSSKPPVTPGTASKPRPAASNPCAHIHGYQRSRLRADGMKGQTVCSSQKRNTSRQRQPRVAPVATRSIRSGYCKTIQSAGQDCMGPPAAFHAAMPP